MLGLETSDLNFDRMTVTFRPNQWRRLKTGTSARAVPLWPQLADILRPYLNAREGEVAQGRPVRQLLFPAVVNGREKMVWGFRHTYCSARLQTLDRGHPVSIFGVGRELGHGGDSLVRRIYGHLGEHRHRAEVVEYRVEQYPHLAERVEQLHAPLLNSVTDFCK